MSFNVLRGAYRGRRVFVTGHTGFKGAWLVTWLREMGAEVTGYALDPESAEGLFVAARIEELCIDVRGDVADFEGLRRLVASVRPDVVFHLAAQSLVRRSYADPLGTVRTNVLGTCNLLEAVRLEEIPCAVVVVTSDKCYENREWVWGYRETDRLGGHDVYSASKAAVEILSSSWERSFFPAGMRRGPGIAVATARAGNVIGGGDAAADRIVPDLVAALREGRPAVIRNPEAVRPWQHVLEPLSGYLLLGAGLSGGGRGEPAEYAGAWNFGPQPEDARPVRDLADAFVRAWGDGTWISANRGGEPHEAGILRLATDKARTSLGWSSRWSFEESVRATAAWYRAQASDSKAEALRDLTRAQIADFAGANR